MGHMVGVTKAQPKSRQRCLRTIALEFHRLGLVGAPRRLSRYGRFPVIVGDSFSKMGREAGSNLVARRLRNKPGVCLR